MTSECLKPESNIRECLEVESLYHSELGLTDFAYDFQLSDMLAVERLIFGGPNINQEDEKFLHIQIMKCRSDLQAYSLQLKDFRNRAGCLVDIDSDTLPIIVFEKLIEVTSRISGS